MADPSGERPKTDFRPDFTSFLKSKPPAQRPNGCAFTLVGMMNYQMIRKNVPMSKEHFEAAKDSLERGDSVCSFVQAENLHVLDSSGTGFVYKAGKGFHHVVHKANQPVPEDSILNKPEFWPT